MGSRIVDQDTGGPVTLNSAVNGRRRYTDVPLHPHAVYQSPSSSRQLGSPFTAVILVVNRIGLMPGRYRTRQACTGSGVKHGSEEQNNSVTPP